MPGASDGLSPLALPPGEDFLDRLAAAMLARCGELVASGDLTSVRVLVPALPIAAELRAAMLRVAPGPLLLPVFDTLDNWVAAAGVGEVKRFLPNSRRLLLLHDALRERGWFDETSLWGIASEMAALFDELTVAAVALPEDVSGLSLQLQRAYAARASAPLAFEARVVHELWRVMSATGEVDQLAAYRLHLSELARRAEGAGSAAPLLVLLDASPDEALDAAERDFYLRYAQSAKVFLYYPAPRSAETSPIMVTLAAAWPETVDGSLFERAAEAARYVTASPFVSSTPPRLQLVSSGGRESEAQAVVAQVAEWLSEGLRRIALIAQDRLTARRVRALLEREGVLVSDETGWKLSTSRAAATVDALLESVAGNAYYSDVLDLIKSPYVFSEVDGSVRKAAVFRIELALRSASVKAGFPKIRKCVLVAESSPARDDGVALIDRLEAACALLDSRPTTLARWIDRLRKALEVLGALAPLAGDAAGAALLELIETRRSELADSAAVFSFASWRDWLNREFEAATFRDASISSPIVLTPLNAVCLRRFQAAVLIGGDSRQLAPGAKGAFFNQSVRRELGLRTAEDSERELRRDLELLLVTVPRVVVCWQAMRDGEANLLAPEFSLLSTLHQLAWGDSLHRPALVARDDALPADGAAGVTMLAMPSAPPELIPRRVSVSAYATLVACPYRFFARHVLGLGEMDEVSEEMEKSDFGALVHRTLELFHERHPRVSALADGVALSALQACVAEVFTPAVKENLLAIGWRLRWEQRLPAYLDWQRENEALGWRWAAAERRFSRLLPIATDAERLAVELYGRIDRIDEIGHANQAGGCAASVSLFDYKAQKAAAIRGRLDEDVQLPTYALLHGDAARAAYVALDDERVLAVGIGGEEAPLMALAEAQGRRLSGAFAAMYAGAPLPAHGVDSVCRWCEMSGLCRRDHVL